RNEAWRPQRPAWSNWRERSGEKSISRDQLRNNFCGNDTRQFLFETLKLERESFVIDAEQAQHGRVEIAHMDRVFHDVIAKIVRHAVDNSRLSAAASHPNSKATGMMVAAIVVFGKSALAIHGAAEFAAPQHQRVVQKSAALQ